MMRIPSVTVTTLLFLALHLALALAVPLVQDEAYYALWATVPSAGYYDHPPMIAWWIWAGETLFGHNRFGVRLLPVLGFALVTPMVWRVTRLAGGDRRAADLAALFYNVTILILALGFTATPDAPSVFFWTAASWAIVETYRSGGRAGQWVLAGGLLGLGVLSKLTNLFLGLGLAGWLLLSREGRRALRSTGPWLGAAVALAVLAPYLWWNATNGWIGLERQFGRIAVGSLQWDSVLGYVAASILLIGPAVFWAAARGFRKPRALRGLLGWLSLPLPIYMLYQALNSDVAANWLAPAYPLAAVFAGLGAARWGAKAVAATAGYGLVITFVLLAAVFWPGPPLIPGQVPPNQVKGWPQTVRQIEVALRDTGAEWIATTQYGLTGQLNHYFRQVPVWAVRDLKRYRFRPSFPQELCTRQALLIVSRGKDSAIDPRELFREVGSEREIVRRSRGAAVQRYRAWPVRIPLAPGFEACALRK